MYDAFKAEISKLTAWVKSAKLSKESQVLFCLTRLAPAYRELALTYESRYAADITRHEQAAVTHVAEEGTTAATARSEELRGRFDKLNERFGLAALPSPPRPAAPRKTAVKKKPAKA